MADILDFEEAKFHRDTGKLLWGEHDVNIDWQDVTVYGATGEPQMTDAISMGEKTRQKVAKLFASFGLPAKPNTYGELLRNVEYCEILILITGGASAGVSLDCMMGSGDIGSRAGVRVSRPLLKGTWKRWRVCIRKPMCFASTACERTTNARRVSDNAGGPTVINSLTKRRAFRWPLPAVLSANHRH